MISFEIVQVFKKWSQPVVLNDLEFINKQAKKFAFLQEQMQGAQKARAQGDYGVLEKTTWEHYKKGLADFECKDLTKTINVPRMNLDYSFSFWSRKK